MTFSQIFHGMATSANCYMMNIILSNASQHFIEFSITNPKKCDKMCVLDEMHVHSIRHVVHLPSVVHYFISLFLHGTPAKVCKSLERKC